MTSLRACAAWASALMCLASAAPAHAGWQSVFQLTCFGCSTPSVSNYTVAPVVANFAPDPCPSPCANPCPCPCPCPQPVAVTRYVQRSFFEPVTTYRLETTMQPVTTYRTSFFWQPVTAFRVSNFFDPCTCSFRQVATPVTSFRLQSQCCPVTSFVQRCQWVPVTTMRQSFYWEAQTSFAMVDPCSGQTVPAAANGAAVREGQNPAVQERGGSPAVPADQQAPPRLPEGDGSRSSYRREYDRTYPAQPSTPPPAKPIVPKLNSIAFDDDDRSGNANLVGRIVTSDGQTVLPGTRLLFLREDASHQREESKADASGRFRVNLASGTWRVYLRDDRGQPTYQTVVTVADKEVNRMTLVSAKR